MMISMPYDFKMNIDLPSARRILKENEIAVRAFDTATELLDELETHLMCGFEVKKFLQEVGKIVFGENSSIYQAMDTLLFTQTKSLNIEFFRSNLFIDGYNYDGVYFWSNTDGDDNNDDNDNNDGDDNNDDNGSNDDHGGNDDNGGDDDNDNSGILPYPPFRFDKLPENLEEAKVYYNHIYESIYEIPEPYSTDESIYYFDTSTQNKVYEDTDISVNDHIWLRVTLNGQTPNESLCLIINDQDEVVIRGRLVREGSDGKFYLEAETRNIDFYTMRRSSVLYRVVLANKELTAFYSSKIRLSLGERRMSTRVLCIDFGTSNTTCGTYTDDGEIKIVNFTDTTSSQARLSALCPTLVYVSRIRALNPKQDLPKKWIISLGMKRKRFLLIMIIIRQVLCCLTSNAGLPAPKKRKSFLTATRRPKLFTRMLSANICAISSERLKMTSNANSTDSISPHPSSSRINSSGF